MSKAGLVTRQVFWELRKEFWQYRGLWMTPVVLGLAPVLIGVLVMLGNDIWLLVSGQPVHVQVAAADFHMTAHDISFGSEMKSNLVDQSIVLSVISLLTTAIVPFLGVLVTVIYASVGFLGDRRDQTILFWRSLPMPDWVVVVARILFCLVCVPLVVLLVQYLLVIFPTSVMMGNFMVHDSVARRLFLNWTTLSTFFGHWFLLMPIVGVLTALWWFPVWSVLLLWSAIVRSYSLLWLAAGVAIVAAGEGMIYGTDRVVLALWNRIKGGWIWDVIVARLGGIIRHVPNATINVHPLPPEMQADGSVMAAIHAQAGGLLIGFAIGGAALVATVYLRRRAAPI